MVRYNWAATWQNQQNECAPSEDSDQPGHPPSLIRVFMKKPWVVSYPLSAQRRLWSDWADAQADLSLRWAHSHIVDFVMSRLNYTHNPGESFWWNNNYLNPCKDLKAVFLLHFPPSSSKLSATYQSCFAFPEKYECISNKMQFFLSSSSRNDNLKMSHDMTKPTKWL